MALITHVQGGTGAGQKRALADAPHKDWDCPKCKARCKFYWRNCPNCGCRRPED